MHFVHVRIICCILRVCSETDAEDDCMYTIEQVQPLAALRPLSSNIMNPEYHILYMKLDFDNPRCSYTCVKDVLGSGNVRMLSKAINIIQEVLRTVRELILVGSH